VVVQGNQPLASQNHKIQAGQVRLVTETFPDLALYPVSLDCKLQVFLRKDQTDPGVTEIIRCRQDQKIPVWNFQLHVVEDFAVISRSQETM
jgi:hypothetical protein